MTQRYVEELEQTLSNSLRSNTIEWALNLEICDMLQASPPLTKLVFCEIERRLRKDKPISVLLALGLLEMIVKNLGFEACRFMKTSLVESLVLLVKKREGWKYSLGRNLHKSGVGSWLGQGASITEEDRKLWLQISKKVLELLQLWTDAFMLQEGDLQPLFVAYKELRKEGVEFPNTERGSHRLCLVRGAEESPAFLATGGGGGMDSARRVGVSAPPEAAPGPAVSPQPPARRAAELPPPFVPPPREVVLPEDVVSDVRSVLSSLKALQTTTLPERGDDGERKEQLDEQRRPLLERLVQLRARIVRLVEGDEAEDCVETLLELFEELNEQLDMEQLSDRGVNNSDTDAPNDVAEVVAVPPPPSEAPPGREQQEQYDFMLARWLQERENEAFFMREQADSALALRLSLEGEGFVGGVGYAGEQVARVAGLAPLQRSRLSQPSQRPQLHAPAARVICAPGAGELLVGGESLDEEVLRSRGHRSAVTTGLRAASSAAANAAASAASAMNRAGTSSVKGGGSNINTSPLLGGGDGSVSLTSFQGGSRHSTSSLMIGLGGGGKVKRLGDGAPSASDYSAIEDDVAPLCGGPPRGKSAKHASGGWPWKSRSGGLSEAKESLLERVQVDEEWEMIRQPDGRSYFHNSATQVSQWHPPEAVRQSGSRD